MNRVSVDEQALEKAFSQGSDMIWEAVQSPRIGAVNKYAVIWSMTFTCFHLLFSQGAGVKSGTFLYVLACALCVSQLCLLCYGWMQHPIACCSPCIAMELLSLTQLICGPGVSS